MSKTYKIKVNQGQGEAKFVDIPPVGMGGKPVVVKAVSGGKYQLQDPGTGYAPENIRASRAGKNLQVFFEGRSTADLVIEDYYDATPEGFNNLMGEAESGRFYEYIPESASGNAVVSVLADGTSPVGMALGGAEINPAGAAVGTLVAAAGLNPLLLAPLALLGAGGGGGGGGPAPTNKDAKITVAKITDDTGLKNDDFVTNDQTLEFSGELSGFNGQIGDKVKIDLVLMDGDKPSVTTYVGYATVTKPANTAADKWVWTWKATDNEASTPLPDQLPEGKYKVTASIVSAADVPVGPKDSKDIVIDIRGDDGPNKDTVIKIDTITDDTGINGSDWITRDTTLTFRGTLEKFDGSTGDGVQLELVPKDSKLSTLTGYATPVLKDGVWGWSWDATGTELQAGDYDLKATLVDLAGNAHKNFAVKKLVVDTTGPLGDAGLKIVSMTVDSGVDVDSRRDFKTNDNTPEFKGTLEKALQPGEMVEVTLLKGSEVIQKAFVAATGTNWSWGPLEALDDASYTLTARVVDAAGNPAQDVQGKVISSKQQAVVIDTLGPTDPTDPNAGKPLSLKIANDANGQSLDRGLSADDFVTNAGTEADKLAFDVGLPAGFDKDKGRVWVQVINKDGVAVTQGEAGVNGDKATFQTLSALDEGTYIVKASVLDVAGNRVSVSDQLLVIDRTLIDIKPVKQIVENLNNISTITELYVGAKEVGAYSFGGKSFEYNGGYFNLTDLQNSKKGVELIFTDVAGNYKLVGDIVQYPFSSNAILYKDPDQTYPFGLPKPGYTKTQPDVVGDFGSIKINQIDDFDMTSLYDGIGQLQKAAVNHIDLTAQGAQKINLSVQDVLALGVENSFLNSGVFKDKIQMRIDGDSLDVLKLTNESGALGNQVWKFNPQTPVNLQGVEGSYYQASNEAFGLEVFVKSGVKVEIF